MKKTLLFAAAVLALAACSKESPVKEDGTIDASKIVFNIQVENADAQATKGIKTAWENGDVVYVFFEDNTTQYVKMTYNGTSWSYADKDGGNTFTGLALTASGKKLSAAYMPNYVCSVAPTYDTDTWTFGNVEGFFQTAESVEYSVISTSDVATLSATISLAAPDNLIQICVPSSEVAAPASGNEYVLTGSHIIPFTFYGIAPGGTASQGNSGIGLPMKAYSCTIGSDTGYYFWGILECAGTYDFDFQLVKRNTEKKYAISSYSKSVTGKTVPEHFAVKLTGLTDNGNFVSLGYAGGPLWATGNLDATNKTIVDPLEAGTYFKYGYITPYSSSDSDYNVDEDPLSTDHDAAYQANNAWRIPTEDQFRALINSDNTDGGEWKANWTQIGGKGGRLFTSNVNGISLFFASVGCYDGASLVLVNNDGLYWSSTSSGPYHAYELNFNDLGIIVYSDSRSYGNPVRPVHNNN